MPRPFEENLSLYANLVVREGLALAPGQELIISADLDHAPFVRQVAAAAYRAGAKHVEVLWTDPQVTLTRLTLATDEALAYTPTWLYDGITRAHRDNAARLGITGTDPALLANVDPQRVATSSRAQSLARKAMSELITGGHMNWCLAGAATPAWAARVFPDLSPDQALDKLWDAIFFTSRVFEPDPVAAWADHCRRVNERMDWLNDLALDAVHFKGRGTDLRVGLVPNHVWAGVQTTCKNGITCSPNIPTEEIFTMPHRLRVDGRVTSSKPLSVRGQVVDGIVVEFRDGRATRATAAKGQDTLQRLLASDDGATRLGEVALVPISGKVAQTNLLFYNSLYDENAASHIAFGAAYAENLKRYADLSEADRLAAGANDSIIHVDWMIGSPDVDVDGLRPDGTPIPLMRQGEWV